jgi:hypothetical protein
MSNPNHHNPNHARSAVMARRLSQRLLHAAPPSSITKPLTRSSAAPLSLCATNASQADAPPAQSTRKRRPHIKVELEAANDADHTAMHAPQAKRARRGSIGSGSIGSGSDIGSSSSSSGNNNGPRPGWREVYEAIGRQRRQERAPVDTLGCAALSDPRLPPAVRRYHLLVSLMLSSQTKDQVLLCRLASRLCRC